MRDLVVVLDAIIKKVPQEEEYLIRHLKSVQNSASYAPPENMKLWWIEATYVLDEYFGGEIPDSEWGKEIFDIWLVKYKRFL